MSRPISVTADYDIGVLNGLISATVASAERYRDAVEIVEDDRTRAILLECADQREDVLVRLHAFVWEHGAPQCNDQIAHAGHSGSGVPLSSTTATLAELNRSEVACRALFAEALTDGELSPETTAIIRECYAMMCESDEQLLELKRGGTPLANA